MPPEMGEPQLQEMFGEHGQVAEVHVVTDRRTGRPKGFAFVEMREDGEARKAIASLDGTVDDGYKLVVNEARARSDFAPRQGR